jgi:hypothetical protein
MPTEGTEMLCLHPPKRLFRLRLRTCGGNTGQQHLQRGPTGTNGDQQPSNPSKFRSDQGYGESDKSK